MLAFWGCNLESVPLECDLWFQAVYNITQTSGECEEHSHFWKLVAGHVDSYLHKHP